MTFEEVYRQFRRPVWRRARRLTGSDEEALDATQEIFLRVWRGLSGFRGESQVSTWIFQIAWNYLRWHRRRRYRRPMEVEIPAAYDGAPGTEPVDPHADPERRASTGDLLSRVEGAIARLPEHQRVVLWLRDAEDLSYEEIARSLELPIGTVR